MMKNKHTFLLKNAVKGCAVLSIFALFSACHQDNEVSKNTQALPKKSAIEKQNAAQEDSISLTQAAGQVVHPPVHDEKTEQHVMGDEDAAQRFVGRYYVVIPCAEDFINCKTGHVEYILNLLPDGKSHRMIAHMGRLYNDENNSISNYRADRWSYDPQHEEIVIHLKEGVLFYFDIVDGQNLKMDIDKSFSAENLNGKISHQAPSKAYMLEKISN